jgi:hypothetical protein
MSETSIEKSAQEYLRHAKNGIPGDMWNCVFPLQLLINQQDDWPDIHPVQTYAEYIRLKFSWNPEIAEAVIDVSDTQAVQKFNGLVSAINKVIGEGVTTKTQAEVLSVLLDDMRELIYGFRKVPPT